MRFAKYHVCRHDIIVAKEREADLDCKLLCHRRLGIGADSLAFITASEHADAGLVVYKADGRANVFCGDALLCAAKHIYDNQWVRRRSMTIETAGRTVELLWTLSNGEADRVTADLGEASQSGKPIYNPYVPLRLVTLGQPYLIVETERLDGAPVNTLGKKLAHSPNYQQGIDVVFAMVPEQKKISLRIWAHGIGEVPCDGTAACSAAVAAMAQYKCDQSVTVQMPGGDLSVVWDEDSNHIFLTGTAERIFEGEYIP